MVYGQSSQYIGDGKMIFLWIWLIGGLLMVIGSILFSTEEEMKRVVPYKMILAYLLWPLSSLAVLWGILASRRAQKVQVR